MNLKIKLIPSKEERMQKAMRNLNDTVKQISDEGSSENPNQCFLNSLRKQFLNQERKATNRGGDASMIIQYRKFVGGYIRL